MNAFWAKIAKVMPDTPPPYDILAARSSFGGTAVPVEADWSEAIETRQGLLWIHITANDHDETAKLLTTFGFHPLAVEDALSDSERPALHHYDHTLFVAANVVSPTEEGEEYNEVGAFVGSTFVVTVTRAKSPCLEAAFQRWMKAPHTTGKNPAFLLHAILDSIVDDYFPASDRLEDSIDALEEEVYDERKEAIEGALLIKRRLLKMRRHTVDIRDIINAILRGDGSLIGNDTRPYFQDVYDHALRIAENLDLNRDILATILDTQLSIISNKLNRIMKIMTALATMLMTASLIAGVYGMNFHFMPELSWKYGYAFALGAMLVSCLAEYIAFKRLGWL